MTNKRKCEMPCIFRRIFSNGFLQWRFGIPNEDKFVDSKWKYMQTLLANIVNYALGFQRMV